MKLALLLAALCASCTAITLAPERPRAQLQRKAAVLALRGGGALTLPKLAIGANIATWGFYGANLWVQPNFILQQIMMAPAAMDFLTPNYAVAQYLGAFYLSQTARMAFALTKASSKSDLLGATVINSLLCLTCVDTYCTHGLRVPASCVPCVPEAPGSLAVGPHALYYAVVHVPASAPPSSTPSCACGLSQYSHSTYSSCSCASLPPA